MGRLSSGGWRGGGAEEEDDQMGVFIPINKYNWKNKSKIKYLPEYKNIYVQFKHDVEWIEEKRQKSEYT
jgi:hypothetical protein